MKTMNMLSHPYGGETDLHKIQAATAEWIALAGFSGYLNPSDITLRLFNGQRKYAPEEIVRLWENKDGQLTGWGMVYPAWNGFEVQLHPNFRQSRLELDILEWAEHEIKHWIRLLAINSAAIELVVFDGDWARIGLLERQGYSRGSRHGTISICSLDAQIPSPRLREGFSIRSLRGEQEIDQLVNLVNDSFGWSRTVDGYRTVMRSPGYSAENELVAIAPDGCFASSCLLLPDARNRSVMFENVGTSKDFRRLGLARALLYAGIQRMKTLGFTAAMVPHATGILPATALYASAGFRPAFDTYHFTKAVVPV